jgi:glucose-1-phosphate thymidylyltransferase
LANTAPARDQPTFVSTDARELVPVANKPILFHVLEALRDADIPDVTLVVHPQTSDSIREVVGDGSSWRLRVRYVELPQLGVIEALVVSLKFLGDAPVLVYSANGLLLTPLQLLCQRFEDGGLDALVSLRWGLGEPVTKPDSNHLPEPGRDLDELQLHEPAYEPVIRGTRLTQSLAEIARGKPALATAGVHIFAPSVLAAASASSPSWRGRIDLAEVIKRLAPGADTAEGRVLDTWWQFDGSSSQLLEGNRLVLDGLGNRRPRPAPIDSVIEGRVSISPSAHLESVRIRGPAIIGPGARVSDAFIGPYTSVGRRAVVHGVEIENSIVMAHAEARDLQARIAGSVIGEGAIVTRDFSLPRVLELAVARGSTAMLG